MRFWLAAISTPFWLLAPAAADNFDTPALEPRTVGRAGAPLSTLDGAAALAKNPAALARDSRFRLELSTALVDSDHSFDSHNPLLLQPCDLTLPPRAEPVIRDESPPARLPSVAVAAPFRGAVVAASVRVSANREELFPRATSIACAADVSRLYPHRYGGTQATFDSYSLTLGGGFHPLASVALGLSVEASRSHLAENRAIWAGDPDLAAAGSPSGDLELMTSGHGIRPAIHAGATWAPIELPVEMTIAASFTGKTALRGNGSLRLPAASSAGIQGPGQGQARLDIPGSLALRAGIRGEVSPLALEVSTEWRRYQGAKRPSWALTDLVAATDSGKSAAIAATPAVERWSDTATVRTALAFEVVDDFLWLTAGAAVDTAPVRLTLALGAEARWDGCDIFLGYARSFKDTVRTAMEIQSPFAAPGSSSSIFGDTSSAANTFGLTIQLSLPDDESR